MREEYKENKIDYSRIIKITRKDIQEIVDGLSIQDTRTREKSLAITKLEEAKMWLGRELGNISGNVDLNKERDDKELS